MKKLVCAAIALAGIIGGLALMQSSPPEAQAVCGPVNNIVSTANGQVIENVTLVDAQQAAIKVTHDNVTVSNVVATGYNCSNAEHEAYAGVSCDGCSGLTVIDSTFTTSATQGSGGIHFDSSGGNNYVARNRIIGGKDGIGTYPEDDASGAFTSGTIEYNHISGSGDDCLQIEGRNEGVTVRRNWVEDCGFAGMGVAPSWVGPLNIEDNLIENPGEECFKVGDSGSGVINMSGNLCYNGTNGGLGQTNNVLGSTFHLTNNFFRNERYFLGLGGPGLPDGEPTSASTFDFDCFDNVSPLAKWDGTVYDTLSGFRTGVVEELNGTLWTTQTDLDTYPDCEEQYMGTDSTVFCADDSWPPDFDNNGVVNLFDLLGVGGFKARFGTSVSDVLYHPRYDLNVDGHIDILDTLRFKQAFGLGC